VGDEVLIKERIGKGMSNTKNQSGRPFTSITKERRRKGIPSDIVDITSALIRPSTSLPSLHDHKFKEARSVSRGLRYGMKSKIGKDITFDKGGNSRNFASIEDQISMT
jgi:hypothetical protein